MFNFFKKKEDNKENFSAFETMKNAVSKTSDTLVKSVLNIVSSNSEIDEFILEDIESALIKADLGVDLSTSIVENIKKNSIKPDNIKSFLKSEFENILNLAGSNILKFDRDKLNIYFITGVNGAGKTTLIGKLAYRFKNEGKKVLLAAADTFRAAAEEQLDIWSKRAGVDIVREDKADAASVVYRAIEKAKAENYNVLIVDTAGRLQNKFNLMQELSKIKSVIDKKRLHDRVKSDPHWALKTVISSFNNQASLKQIKTELVPSILTPTEWNTWSKEAKNILDRDSEFGNLPDQTDVFTVRDTPITVEEKLYNNFKANPKFYSRVKVMREFLKECQPDSEYFNEMYTYFTSYLKEIDRPNDINVSAYILIREIVKEYPYLNPGIDKHFKDIFKDKNRLVSVFERIEDAEIRKSFIRFVKEFSDWPIIYMKLFPKCLNRSILEDLAAQNRSDCISQMFEEIASNFREDRTAFIWLMKNAEEYKDLCKIQEETFVINAIQLLSTLYKEMDNRYNVSENRKLAQQIESILFKEGRLEKTVQKISSDKLSKIYSLVNEIKGLSLALKQDVRRMISETHPEFQFGDEQSKTLSARDIISRSLLVLQRSHQAKSRELKYIIDVEIPNNSKEIGEALELGDLKENAEYKAAKEKQAILNATASKLQEDLEKAYIFKKEEINTSQIGFGTQVTLQNLLTQKDESFTILGPWESDPNENIISYLSPFGKNLIGAKPGDTLEFEINEIPYKYKVKKIAACDNID